MIRLAFKLKKNPMQLDNSDLHSLGFYFEVQITALVLGVGPHPANPPKGSDPLQDSAAVTSAASCLRG